MNKKRPFRTVRIQRSQDWGDLVTPENSFARPLKGFFYSFVRRHTREVCSCLFLG